MPGRNDRCPCGSGKKYKRCCLKKEQTSIKNNSRYNEQTFLNNPILLEEFMNENNIIPSYPMFSGLRDYILGILERLIFHLKGEKRNDFLIQYTYGEVGWILRKDINTFFENTIKIAKLFEFTQTKIDGLGEYLGNLDINKEFNHMEKAHVLSCLTTLGAGYAIDSRQDYDAMRVVMEFCYRGIRENIMPDKFVKIA